MRFEEILVACTVFTGIVCLLNYFLLKNKGWLVETCKSFFPVFVIVLVLRSFIFEPFRIPTGSMKPTLLEGDFILVNKFAYGLRLPVWGATIVPLGKPKTGDIVVFRHTEGKDLIKRVIGLPGDHIQYLNRQLYINGVAVHNKEFATTQDHGMYTIESIESLNDLTHGIYDYPKVSIRYRYTDVIVPPDSYFVMGDSRSNSADSRYWGFLKDKDIMGKAVLTWMSWDSDMEIKNIPIRWSRIGKSIYKYSSETDVKS